MDTTGVFLDTMMVMGVVEAKQVVEVRIRDVKMFMRSIAKTIATRTIIIVRGHLSGEATANLVPLVLRMRRRKASKCSFFRQLSSVASSDVECLLGFHPGHPRL